MIDYWKSLSLVNKIKFAFSLFLGVIGVVFATLNWNSHEVHLLYAKKNIPLSLLIIFSLIAGYAIASVTNYRKFRAKDREIEKLTGELKKFKPKDEH